MRISDWSSDVCSSDLSDGNERDTDDPRQILGRDHGTQPATDQTGERMVEHGGDDDTGDDGHRLAKPRRQHECQQHGLVADFAEQDCTGRDEKSFHSNFPERSEEHTSELQSLMRISYAVFCLKNKKTPST